MTMTLKQFSAAAERGASVRWSDGRVETLSLVDTHLAGMALVATAQNGSPRRVPLQDEYDCEEVTQP